MLSLIDYNFKAHIHMYRWNELNIVLDVNSGAIHVLDEVAYQLLEEIVTNQGDIPKAIETCTRIFPRAEVTEAAGDITSAYEAEALFTAEEDLVVDLSGMKPKALCLNIAHACNMKCRYCFASQGDFGMKPALMSLDIGKKSLDFLIAQSAGIKNLEVDFFGGEPLLNADVVRELVRYGREREVQADKHINFTLTTNALLLNEDIIQFVIDNQISVILSLDGRPEINDRQRILNNGQGTYDLILPNIKKMVARKPVSYYIRGTFTRSNLDFTSDVKHLVDLGFENISLEPAIGADNSLAIQKEDLPQVLNEYEHLTNLLLEYHQAKQDIHFFHYNLDLQRGPCIARRSTGCGAGVEYLVITPTGDIYPCHQFVGEDEFYMGNVNKGDINPEIRNIFQNNHLRNKSCRFCWARYFCGGGCHANAYYAGDIKKPNEVGCIMHQKRVEGAIYLDLQKRLQKNK